MDLTMFFFFLFTVYEQRQRIRDDLLHFRDTGRPFEMHNSLTRSWNRLRHPIPVTVWFHYYRELENFVLNSEGRSPLYIHGTVFLPFHMIAYDHMCMEVYRMFYFNTPYRVYNFIPRLRFRLLFISSTTFGGQIRIERLFVTSRVSDTLYHDGMACES